MCRAGQCIAVHRNSQPTNHCPGRAGPGSNYPTRHRLTSPHLASHLASRLILSRLVSPQHGRAEPSQRDLAVVQTRLIFQGLENPRENQFLATTILFSVISKFHCHGEDFVELLAIQCSVTKPTKFKSIGEKLHASIHFPLKGSINQSIIVVNN